MYVTIKLLKKIKKKKNNKIWNMKKYIIIIWKDRDTSVNISSFIIIINEYCLYTTFFFIGNKFFDEI